MGLIDVHNHLGVEMGAYLRGELPYGQSAQQLLDDGDRYGVSHFVVFPMVSNLSQQLPALRRAEVRPNQAGDGGLETVPYAWENRRMCHEVYRLLADRAVGVLPFAMFDPGRVVPAQIEALRQLRADYRIHGLKTQPTILQSPIKALHDVGRPFLELAQEWDVPMLIHSSIMPSDHYSQAADILDIAEAWPGVRFNVAHSCRFDKPSLDRLASLANCWFDVSAHGIHCDLALQDSPAVAVPERRFTSDFTRPDVVLRDLTLAYPHKVLWGSDSPYYTFVAESDGVNFALLSTFERETGFVQALPPELMELAGWSNPIAWLGREIHEFV